MHKILIPLVFCLLVTDALAQRDRGRNRERGDDSSVALEHFTFKRVDYEAPSLKGNSKSDFGIYLPKGYDDEASAGRRYPWIIWLHGMNEDYQRFHFGGAKVLDQLRGAGKVPELILVAPSAARRTLYMNGESGGNFEDLILQDLTQHVEKEYRVATDREHRAIMGISMGGAGALKFAFKYPQRFAAVAVHSAALMPADPENLPERYQRMADSVMRSMGLDQLFGDPIDKTKLQREMPAGMLLGMSKADLAGLHIYFDAGTDDRYGFAPLNEDFAKSLEAKGIEHTFHLIEGGGHSWGTGSTQKAMVRSLEFVSEVFAGTTAPPAPAPTGTDKAADKDH